ncbi:LOW QUALITY PROTEIN: hypothetical protein CVT26_015634 [Gymnopilus dilepis]|uniref:Uncharacterized protein n=1 Tax=Gymnopilus dilepis TaxID=231916 RepID=A0A409YDD7_9AGAR|nr:LOW QUALITY PROTEIN: hypothetical protein CVT26_015634 [Gymnopilus dilepis]
MPNRKSKSGGQSQGPKQGAGGGAPRSPNPHAANKPRSQATPHPQAMRNANSKPKPPASTGTAAAPSRPPQPQPTPHRPSNGTKPHNGGNGAPKSQGAKNSNFVRGEHQEFGACVHELCGPTLVYTAPEAHRASQERVVNLGTSKRNGNGLNDGRQQVQGHSPRPNIPLKNEAPKPKHSQAFFGGQSSATNSALPSSPRPGYVQNLHVPKGDPTGFIQQPKNPHKVAHGASISGNKVFQDPLLTSKQNDHTKPHARKPQDHASTAPKGPTVFPGSPFLDYQQKAGKNTASNTFPKVQVETKDAQHLRGGGQLSAPSAQFSEKPSHMNKPQQQHKAPPQSSFKQETYSKGECFDLVTAMFTLADDHGRFQGHPSQGLRIDEQGKTTYGKCAVKHVFPLFHWILSVVRIYYFFNRLHIQRRKLQQMRRIKLEMRNKAEHIRTRIPCRKCPVKNTPTKSPVNNRNQVQMPMDIVLPKGSSSSPSTNKGRQPAEGVLSNETSFFSNECRKDTPPKASTNKGKPPTESAMSNFFSFFSSESEAPGNLSRKSQHAQQGRGKLRWCNSPFRYLTFVLLAAPPHTRPAQEASNQGKCSRHKNTLTKTPMNDRDEGQPPTGSMLPKVASSPSSANKGKPPTEDVLSNVLLFSSTELKGIENPSPRKSKHAREHRAAPPHLYPAQEMSNKDDNVNVLKDHTPMLPMNDGPQRKFPIESVLPTMIVSPSDNFTGPHGTQSRAAKKQEPNVAKASANLPQPAAVGKQSWGQMIASWFSPSAAANKSSSSSKKVFRMFDTAHQRKAPTSSRRVRTLAKVKHPHSSNNGIN